MNTLNLLTRVVFPGVAFTVLFSSSYALWRPAAQLSELVSFASLILAILALFVLYSYVCQMFVVWFSGAKYETSDTYVILRKNGKTVSESACAWELVVSSIPTLLLLLLFIPAVRENAVAPIILTGLLLTPVARDSFRREPNMESQTWNDTRYEETLRELREEWTLSQIEAKLSTLILASMPPGERTLSIRVDEESSGIPGILADMVYENVPASESEFLHEYFVACVHIIKRQQGREISNITCSVVEEAVQFSYE